MRYLIISALMTLSGITHAAVTAETTESQMATLLFSGCQAQRTNITMDEAVDFINPNGNPGFTDLIIKGYKFGQQYPDVGCNQFFTTVIDQLVKSRGKV